MQKGFYSCFLSNQNGCIFYGRDKTIRLDLGKELHN